MRRAIVPALFLLALLATACGTSTGTSSAQPLPSTTAATTTTTLPPDASVSSPPLSPGNSTPSRPDRVVPSHEAAGVNPLSFEPSAARAVGRFVVVPFWGGIAPCFVLDHVTVRETPTVVTITLYAGHARTNGDQMCIELAKLYEVQVRLRAPLGTRALRSGA